MLSLAVAVLLSVCASTCSAAPHTFKDGDKVMTEVFHFLCVAKGGGDGVHSMKQAYRR